MPNSRGLYWHYAHHPLADAGVEEVRAYKFTDMSAAERYELPGADVARSKSESICIADVSSIFTTCLELRGFDLAFEPSLVNTLAERAL
jgi:hypothetical protein